MGAIIIVNPDNFTTEIQNGYVTEDVNLVVTGLAETIIPGCDISFTSLPSGPVALSWSIQFSENDVGNAKEATLRVRRGGLAGTVIASQVFGDDGDDVTGEDQDWTDSTEDLTPGTQYVLTIQETAGSSGTEVYALGNGTNGLFAASLSVSASDPIEFSDALGIPLSLGVPPSLQVPDPNLDTFDRRDGTYTKAIIDQLFENHPDGWFVVRQCGDGFARPVALGTYDYPYEWYSTFSTGSAVDDPGVVTQLTDVPLALTGDASYVVTGGKLTRLDNDADDFVLFDAETSRGNLSIEFTALPAAGSAIILHYADAENFWRVVFRNPGWQIEQVVAGGIAYVGTLIGDATLGIVNITAGPSGIQVAVPGVDAETDFAPDTDLATTFGFVLQGDGVDEAEITQMQWVPEFQIGYYKPLFNTAAAAIPACGAVSAVATLSVDADVQINRSVITAPIDVTSSLPGDVDSPGTIPDVFEFNRRGATAPAPAYAPLNHTHGREFLWHLTQVGPIALLADADDYNPTGWDGSKVLMHLVPTAEHELRGLDPGIIQLGNVRLAHITNASPTDSIIIKNEAVTSVATNRFITPTGGDFEIPPLNGVLLAYQNTGMATDRWVTFGFLHIHPEIETNSVSTYDLIVGGATTYAGIIGDVLFANADDWAPTGFADASIIQVAGFSANLAITGIAGGSAGRTITLMNVGAYNFYLNASSASSALGNRITIQDGTNHYIEPGSSATLWYDPTTVSWWILSERAGALQADVALSGVITASDLTADTNDWAPTGIGTASVVRFGSNANWGITGISGGYSGRVLVLMNAGSYTVTLHQNNGSSLSANRMWLPANSSYPIQTGGLLMLVYDGTVSKWRAVSNQAVMRHVTPTNITADTNDWNPGNTYEVDVIRLGASASWNITGMVGGMPFNKPITITNTSLYPITLKHSDAASASANRFWLPRARDLVLNSYSSVSLWYDDTSNHWRILSDGQQEHRRTLNFIIDGGGSAITTGVKGDVTMDFDGRIIEWTVLSDVSGSIVVDIWKDTYTNYPPTVADTITGAEKPTLSSATKNVDSTLNSGAGWTFTANDTLRFNVDSATTVTRVTVALTIDITG